MEPMEYKGKVTLEEISKEINISRTTIYKILNNKGKVSEKTRQTVLDAVEKYNYIPNEAAKNLARNKQYNIAFVGFHSPRTPYTQRNLLKGVRWAADEFKDHGLNVELSLGGPGTEQDQVLEIYRLAESGIDGFVISPD
jgi:LacI family transcriptional regulator